jgi:branched-chain amino acid transport system substrate-binding protein
MRFPDNLVLRNQGVAMSRFHVCFAVLVLGLANAASAQILIGQSAGMTGGQAEYSKDVRTGLLAYFEAANRAGGVHGQQIKLLTEDDKGSRDQVVANTKKLIEKDNVFALVGYTSGAGVEAALPVIAQAKVPMLSPATGNAGIRLETHRYLFHTRAGYADEMRRVVDTLATVGVKRFALVYLSDTTVNRKVMEDALSANNLKAVAAIGLDRNAKDFGTHAEALAESDAQAILFITNAKPVVDIVRSMRRKNYGGEFISSSFAGTGFIDALKTDAAGVKVTQVLPSPDKTSVRIVKEFRENLQKVDDKMKPNYTNLEGYIAARMLVEGLRRAGKGATREKFVAALEGISEIDLGGYEVGYNAKSHGGSRFVDIGVVNNRGQLVF